MNATRIDAACFRDGNEDEYEIEFWHLPGSIFRTCYNRRTTCTERRFIDADSWEYRELRAIFAGQNSGYTI